MIEVAKVLKKVGAFNISDRPYTWASGIQSPFYCDNRVLLSHPKEWSVVIDAFCELITTKYPQCEGLAGVATAGIPHASAIATKLGLPMIYVRSSPKGHGRENLIEGKLERFSQVLMIEDLVSTGGSSLKAAEAVSEEHEVLGVVSIFSYGLKVAQKNFAYIPLKSLTNLDELISVFDLSSESTELIKAFKEKYC